MELRRARNLRPPKLRKKKTMLRLMQMQMPLNSSLKRPSSKSARPSTSNKLSSSSSLVNKVRFSRVESKSTVASSKRKELT